MSKPSTPQLRAIHSDSVSAPRADSIAQLTIRRAETTDVASLTPEQYADAVRDHSWQTAETSLYPGLNYEILARYLRRDFEQKPRPSIAQSHRSVTPTEPFPFVTVYTWDGSGSWGASTSYERPSQFLDLTASRDKPMMIFLRGKPSSMWLSTLGATFKIDPEFFNRHLDMYANLGRTDYFATPSLPSEQPLMFSVPYITIGRMTTSGWQNRQSIVSKLRSEAAHRMSRFYDVIYDMFSSDYATGESLVRQFHLHDQANFALEQRISVALNKTAGSWQLFIWLDTGKSLSQSPECAPWHGLSASNQTSTPHRTSLYPAIRVSPSAALKSHVHKVDTVRGLHDDLAQSIALLHQHYGKTLDPVTMAASPFYALYEVLQFVAVTYRQYFNMLEYKDSHRTSLTIHGSSSNIPLDDPENWDSTSIRHDRAILETYLPQLQAILDVIRHRGNSGPPVSAKYTWPSNSKDPSIESRIAASASSLHRDYEDLIAHAHRLLSRYNDNMTLMMNRAVTAEASKSLAQAREVTKLTRLAFIYIPLSFTCSFFGMNVSELSHWAGRATQPPLWLWVVVSAPFLLFSLILLNWDLIDVWKLSVAHCRALLARRRSSVDKNEVEGHPRYGDGNKGRDFDTTSE